MGELSFIFRPRGRGLQKVLGELEAAVMEVVWRRGRAAVRDVHHELLKKRPIAYTTVMTTMARLARKGFLSQEKEGTAYYYKPLLTKEELASSVAGEILDSLLEAFGEAALSQIMSRIVREDPARMEQLGRLIRERRKR